MKPSEFFIDSEDFSEAEKSRLCAALEGLAQSDLPLAIELIIVSEEERSVSRP